MRLVILTWQYLPKNAGGTEIATFNVASQLTLNGHEVLIITTRDKGLTFKSNEEGVYIYRIVSLWPKWLKYSWFCLNAILIIQKYKPDLIHAQAIWTGLPALCCKLIFGIRYVLWAQGSDIYYPRAFKGIISRVIVDKSDAPIALTNDMKCKMQKLTRRTIFIIPNGIDLNRFNTVSLFESRAKLGIAIESNIIIFVGSLVPIKGVNFLLESMPQILVDFPNSKLILIGDGGEEKNLRSRVIELGISRQVTFVGRVLPEIVVDYLSAANVFVLPSLSEGFPLVILEAMAAGLPIICTDVRGMADIIRDGQNGLLIQSKNSEDIANGISQILSNKVLFRKISNVNRKKASNYRWEIVVARLEQIYFEIAPNYLNPM